MAETQTWWSDFLFIDETCSIYNSYVCHIAEYQNLMYSNPQEINKIIFP